MPNNDDDDDLVMIDVHWQAAFREYRLSRSEVAFVHTGQFDNYWSNRCFKLWFLYVLWLQ